MGIRSRLGKIFSRKKGNDDEEVAPAASIAVAPRPPAPKTPPKVVEKPAETTAEAPKQLSTSVSDGIAPFQEAVSSAFEPLWTLEDRDDGFNDVREAIKERQKPYEELKASLENVNKAPAVRWARVLFDEAKELANKK